MTSQKKTEKIEWSNSTPLVTVLEGGWKEYPVNDFHSEFIITMRMRGYAMDKDSKITYSDGETKEIKKEDMQLHIVFHQPIKKGKGEVFQPA